MPRFWPFLLILPLLLLPLLLSPAVAEVEEAAAVLPDAAVSYYIAPLAVAEVPQIGLLTEGGVVQLDAESYLIGVVAAEMPVSFAAEALAAQAVAARSYLLAHSAPYGSGRHTEAAVCSDSGHCQAYLSVEQLRQRWGSSFEQNYAQVAAAVAATRGLVLWYEDAIAEAPFCSACGGRTEAAAEIWGGEVPYLTATACNSCTHAPRYRQTERLALTDAAAKLACTEPDLLSMQLLGESSGGRVASLRIGSAEYSGRELRTLLDLPSAAFSWLIDGDSISIFCRGYGHGVGLCQYGADGMAQRGARFAEILNHYYPGTQLRQLY